MKTLKTALLFVMGVLLCSTDVQFSPETDYTPVLLSRNDLLKSIEYQETKEFSRPGKIYLYHETVFVVEKYEGIHVIDNSNPRSPQKAGFIRVPGCIDVAVKDSVLYADNAVDLVAINITNYPAIEEDGRFRDVFPEHTPPDIDFIPSVFSSRTRPNNTVIVDWEKISE